MTKIRNKFERERVQVGGFPPSKTVQEDTDIKNIVERFQRTGTLPNVDRQPQYGDVSHLNEDLGVLLARKQETERRIADYMEKKKNEEMDKGAAKAATQNGQSKTGTEVPSGSTGEQPVGQGSPAGGVPE